MIHDGKHTLINNYPGGTESALGTLEKGLKELSIKNSQGAPVQIYEFRTPDTKNNQISLYLKSKTLEISTGPSFWVPKDKDYSEIPKDAGGTGTMGYQKSIALIYRHLSQQPRMILELDKKDKEIFSEGELTLMGKRPEEMPIKRTVEEDITIIPKVHQDLGFGYSFIFFDTESTRDFTTPEYETGGTWDLYHGLREWENPQELISELNLFDAIISYNGNYFDIGQILGPNATTEERTKLKNKSIDLYKVISSAISNNRRDREKGGHTLANVGFSTLGMTKWEDFYEPDLKSRRESVDEGGLVDHCLRDVEILRDLFFYMEKNGHIYYTSRHALSNGKVVQQLPTWEELSTALKSKGLK